MNLKRSTVRFFTALLIIISLIYSDVSIVFAANDEAVKDSTVDLSVFDANNENSYSAYLAQFSDSDYSSQNVVCDLKGTVLENDTIEFDIQVEENGLYGIGMSYKALDDQKSTVNIGVMLDGDYPYSNMRNLTLPRMWTDSESEITTDDAGNEFAAQQILYTEYYYSEAVDETVECGEKFAVYLTKGTHKVAVLPISGKVQIEYFKFSSLVSADKYSAPTDKSQFYTGERIVIEGEDAAVKSSYFLVDKNDSSAADVTPQSAERSLMNYIGGGNWKTVGETLVWQTPELEAGYYQIGFFFRQNTNIGGKSYRILTVDGEIPFSEAEKIGFSYDDNWQEKFFSDKDDTPYLIYLSEGTHEIALTVTAADIAEVRSMLTNATSQLGDLYVDMTKITGETVDIYRDYDLFSQIGDMQERLENIRSLLKGAGERLLEITGEDSGSNYSVIMNMVMTVEQMLDNKYEAHRYKSTYYSNYCSVSSVLQELRSMPLDLDKISLTAVGENEPFEKSNFIDRVVFSIKRFIVSFTKDYNGVSASKSEDNSVTVWVSWGRDQAQVLNALVKRSFTPETGIDVNLKLVNASVIQATLSGKGPDCLLQQIRSEPVNLAMRDVLYDLSQFEDCDEVLERFQDGADTPYRYKEGLYALPDTQTFFMMFYRKDILAEYGLEVPETWEEFDLVAKLLMRNNMSVYLPNSTVSSVAQANVGVGSNNIYPSLLLQNGISLYSEDGKQTNLLSADAMEVFKKWTDYYSKLKFPVSLDFYNRFRTGTTPLGIATYTTYTTFKVAAPEIDGLWGITSIPGTIREDGTVSYASSGGGTGCVILKDSNNPKGAWEFLKWWTDADTQLTYSNDLESILGPTGRVALSNVEALKGLSWDEGECEQILNAWQSVEEIPEYPGSYYVSRSIYQAYWNVVNSNKNTKDMLMKYGTEANDEIARKWKQYTNR